MNIKQLKIQLTYKEEDPLRFKQEVQILQGFYIFMKDESVPKDPKQLEFIKAKVRLIKDENPGISQVDVLKYKVETIEKLVDDKAYKLFQEEQAPLLDKYQKITEEFSDYVNSKWPWGKKEMHISLKTKLEEILEQFKSARNSKEMIEAATSLETEVQAVNLQIIAKDIEERKNHFVSLYRKKRNILLGETSDTPYLKKLDTFANEVKSKHSSPKEKARAHPSL